MLISKEEFQSLLVSPGYKLFKAYLEKLLENEKTRWSEGQFTSEFSDGTIQMNAAAIGRANLLRELLSEDTTYETIVETIDEK